MQDREKSWTPRCLREIREPRGFDSQRKLAQASGVDPQTISRIEAGGTMSLATAKKLAPPLYNLPEALFVTHNLTIIQRELTRGYLSRAQARKDRNYLEDVIAQAAPKMPTQDYEACKNALVALNDTIERLHNAAIAHGEDWPSHMDEYEPPQKLASSFADGERIVSERIVSH